MNYIHSYYISLFALYYYFITPYLGRRLTVPQSSFITFKYKIALPFVFLGEVKSRKLGKLS